MSILPVPSLNTLVAKTIKNAKNITPSQKFYQHKLHYLFKGLGQLPTPIIEQLNSRLQATTTEQYPHADAHLRLIMAINNILKKPLTIDILLKLRQKFATDIVSIQAPSVWQQASISSSENNEVNWQDKVIANGDGGNMTIRCYQSSDKSAQQKESDSNSDNIAMLFFHGGGFCIGDLDTHHEFCHTVCSQTGWAVVSVDYRLAPEYHAPTALKDCIAAYAWLAKNSYTLGASSSRIVLSGDSAGGCLAILVAQQVINPTPALWKNLSKDQHSTDTFIAPFTDSMRGLPPPLAQLPLYPVTDYDAEYPSWNLYGQGLLLDHAEAEVFNTAYVKQSDLPQTHPLVSVMNGDNTDMCPSYIVVAELDILRDEATAYAKLLQDSDISVQSYTVLGAPHGFINLLSVHKGIGTETTHIINEFAKFVQDLLTTKGN